jgi:hypothetical protein
MYIGLKLFAHGSLVGMLSLAILSPLRAQASANVPHSEAIPLNLHVAAEVDPQLLNVPHPEAIPKAHYKSWSLFLICNPSWILANGDEGIGKLFRAYTAFGKAIGPDNLAVWFSDPPGQVATTENTDIERMSHYCEKFGLLPSQTPQVVTTTRHPDDPDVDAGGKIVANLNGDALNSAYALTDLTDELLRTGLNQRSLDTSEWGRRIGAVASAVMASAACYLNKVSISIKTGVFNAEIVHSSDGKC